MSALVAAIYIAVAASLGGGASAFQMAIFCLLPLACIWFADAMRGYTGPTPRGAFISPSAGLMVCVAGWMIMLLPVFFLFAAWCLT